MNARIEWIDNSAKGHIVAMFDLFYGSFMIRGFKLMKDVAGKDKLWVSMPSHQFGPEDNRRWSTSCWIPDVEKKKKFEAWVLSEWYKKEE